MTTYFYTDDIKDSEIENLNLKNTTLSDYGLKLYVLIKKNINNFKFDDELIYIDNIDWTQSCVDNFIKRCENEPEIEDDNTVDKIELTEEKRQKIRRHMLKLDISIYLVSLLNYFNKNMDVLLEFNEKIQTIIKQNLKIYLNKYKNFDNYRSRIYKFKKIIDYNNYTFEEFEKKLEYIREELYNKNINWIEPLEYSDDSSDDF